MGVLKKRWWISLLLLTKVGQGPVEFELPEASGDAFIIFDSEAANAWLTIGAVRSYHRCDGRVLTVPEEAEGPCTLEGSFGRALFIYLDRASFHMSVADALWLVDYGF